MNNNDIKQIEISIEEANIAVKLAKALVRLEKNKDFKQVITEAYFKEDAQRLVLLKAAPAAQEERIQKAIESDMNAIGSLFQHFHKIKQLGSMAEKELISAEEERLELIEEDE